jgi:CSLREA domain-containing protein
MSFLEPATRATDLLERKANMKRLKTLCGKGFKLGARALLAAALVVAVLGMAAPPASAATVVVNTTTDQALGSCSGSCSLRDAVATANSGDTIHVPAGHYVLTLGDIIFGTSLTIAGDGARSTILDGNGASRVFQFFNFDEPQTVELDDLSLINGLAATPDLVVGNLNGGALAGGTFAGGASLTLRRCHLAANQAQGAGAIIWYGNLTIDQCTIAGNLATFGAGGIVVVGDFTLTITNSTLTGNKGDGAFLFGVSSVFNLANVTVTANHGFGIALGGNGSISNSIIADNPGGDCGFVGTFASDHNLDSDNTCGFTSPGDLPGVAPLLGPLANNGGPTDTQALLAGSPAIDAGNNATCLATDQRGVTRPQGPACDMGAFEASATPQDQIAALIAQINALVTGGALAPNKANPLITKLDQVVNKLDAGQTTAACNQLGAFINQVNAYIAAGTLTAAQGQALIDATNAIRADIGC